MTRPLISAVACAAAAMFAVVAHAGSDAASKQGDVGTAAFSGALKLQKTYNEVGQGSGQALVAGFNPYGSTLTVSCTNSAGCFLIVNANAQVRGVATANPTAIGIKVDGGYINAPFANVVSTTSFTVVSYQTGVAIPLGNHTVSTDFYTTQATNLYQYNTEVKLYKQ